MQGGFPGAIYSNLGNKKAPSDCLPEGAQATVRFDYFTMYVEREWGSTPFSGPLRRPQRRFASIFTAISVVETYLASALSPT